MGEYESEKAAPGEVVKIAVEIEKVVLSTETVKGIFAERYGRPVELIAYDIQSGEWTIDFLVPSEVPEDPPGVE